MKKLHSIVAALAIFAVAGMAGLIVGCKHMDSDERGSAHVHTYTCTMHPEVVQNTPGNCPKCGMKLVHKD
jgi:Cu(I)/Ag(I) efflux system membrane fusion protein